MERPQTTTRRRAVGATAVLTGVAVVAAGVAGGRSFAAFRRTFTPVLLYHALTDDPAARDDMQVSVAAFARQMRWLVRHGYQVRPCSLADLPGARPHSRTVAVSFDDGFASVVRLAGPILQACGAGATVFVSTAFIDTGAPFPWPYAATDPPLSWDQVRELVRAGFTVGSHAATHVGLTALDAATLTQELCASRAVIAREVGVAPELIAYPYGDGAADARVRGAVAAAGYTAGYGVCVTPEQVDRYAIPRLTMRHQTTLWGLRLRVLGIHPYLKSRAWFGPLRRRLAHHRQAFW